MAFSLSIIYFASHPSHAILTRIHDFIIIIIEAILKNRRLGDFL